MEIRSWLALSLFLSCQLWSGSEAGLKKGTLTGGKAGKGAGSSRVKEVSEKELEDAVDDNDYVAVLFHEGKNSKTDKIIRTLESVDTTKYDVPLLRCDSVTEGKSYGLMSKELPALVVFDNGIPDMYKGDLSNPSSITDWINDEVRDNDVDVIDLKVLAKVVKKTEAVLVIFLDDPSDRIHGEDEIQDVCDRFDIAIAKVVGRDSVEKTFGIEGLPAIAYFEKGVPSVYEDPLDDDSAVVEWIEEHRTQDTIEVVTEEMLQYLSKSLEYVAVFFTGPCDERAKTDQECENVLNELENIDDELDDFGIHLITTEDIKYAGIKLGIRKFPALGMFRNGDFLLYEGELKDEKELLSWLIDEETLEIQGKIEEVGKVMLSRLLEEEENVAVLFYETETRQVQNVLETLEKIDESFDRKGIEMVKCNDEDVALDDYGLTNKLPFLVFFGNEVPTPFPEDGNILDDREVGKWIAEMAEGLTIPTVGSAVLENLVENIEDLVVLFYDQSKKKQVSFIDDVENVDDDAEKLDMIMVKVPSVNVAKEYGLYGLPAVVHFEKEVPNVYDGDLTQEALMNWLGDQKIESHIEKVTGAILDKLVMKQEYVAVLLLSDCDKAGGCEERLSDLEVIDEELDKIDVLFTYTDDDAFITKLKLDSGTPAVVLFRNGDPIVYDGNIENEMGILKFLSDLDNLLMPGKIEEVGIPLLEHIIKERQHVFAFLYKEGDGRAQKILKELDGIDDNLENDNILLVKCSDKGVADEYGIGYLPRLIFYEDEIPEPFTGDLHNEGAILNWMADEVTRDEIKSVTRAVLERLVDKLDQIGVVFVDEEDEEEAAIITNLVKIHDDLREENLVLVQVDDADYEDELGLVDLPMLVSFCNDIPSIYSGEETNEAIMSWMLKIKNENIIEEVTEEIITMLKEDEEYVGVFFSGECTDESCQDLIEKLETIDDELANIGIMFVQTKDLDYPYNAHEIPALPALGLYRNGDFLLYNGSMDEEDEIRKWFMDEDNLKISDVVEEINEELLLYLYETDDNIVVLFYEQTDRDADEIVQALEEIDSQLDAQKISMVKIDDEGAEEQYGLTELPALVYIQNGIPNMYHGNLFDPQVRKRNYFEERNKTESTNLFIKYFYFIHKGHSGLGQIRGQDNPDPRGDRHCAVQTG